MRVPSLVVLVAALLAGCAAAPAVAPPDAFLADRRFAAPKEAVRTDDVFGSDAMHRYLAVDIADQIRIQSPQVRLVEALRKHTQLRLEYDAARTKDAAATFASHNGNCLSLVIMTAAFAKELGLPEAYQAPASWTAA